MQFVGTLKLLFIYIILVIFIQLDLNTIEAKKLLILYFLYNIFYIDYQIYIIEKKFGKNPNFICYITLFESNEN